MAEGTQRLAAEIGRGSEQFAMQVKGLELPMHDPRLKAGMGLGYAVAPVGADHMMNIHDTDYTSPAGKLARVNTVYAVDPLSPGDLGEAKTNLLLLRGQFPALSRLRCAVHAVPHTITHRSPVR